MNYLFAVTSKWLLYKSESHSFPFCVLLVKYHSVFLECFIWPTVVVCDERIYSLIKMLHVTNTIFEIPVMFSIVGLLYFFYKTWRTDPGYVKSSEKDKKEVS